MRHLHGPETLTPADSGRPDFTIRHSTADDLEAVISILNHYVETHHCTFDTRPWTSGQKRDWFDGFAENGPYQFLVADARGRVLGYAFSARWRPKAAYDVTAETTIYVAPDQHARGIGKALLAALLDRLADTALHSVVAGVTQPGPASNRLHEALGYEPVGIFRRAGHKFGRYWDVRWYQRFLGRENGF